MIIISDVLLASVWLYMCHESDTILSTACTASVQSHSRYFICEKPEAEGDRAVHLVDGRAGVCD